MNRSRIALVTLAVIVAGCATPSDAPIRLRVIGINDFHGNLESTGLSLVLADPTKPGATMRVATGGAAGLAGTIASLRAGSPNSVLLSAGDMIGAAPLPSSLFKHESTVDVMNRLGVDIATPGNHEFDAGRTELLRIVGGGCAANEPGAAAMSCALEPYNGMRFDVVASNIETAPGQTLFPAFSVRQYGPVKVGFIGATTKTTPSIVMPAGVAGLTFIDEADGINRAAATLKAQGVNAIVVTIHEGVEIGAPGKPAEWNDPDCPGLRGDLVDINKRLSPDIDVIMSGHTHQGYRCIVDGRPIMSAVSYGRGVSVADLLIDPRTGRVDHSRIESRNLPVFNERTDPAMREAITAAMPPTFAEALRATKVSPEITERVATYAAAVAPRANREIGRITGPFDRSGRGDSTLGRLVADAQLAATREPSRGGAQMALMNSGGIRSDLPCRGTPPCSVTYGDMFTMQPFGNSLVVMTLTGAEIKATLEAQRPSVVLNPSSGLRFRWSINAPAGQRISNLTLEGQPILPGTEYRVTVNSFMADGGDAYLPLRNGRARVGGLPDVDAMLEFLKAPRSPSSAARIDLVE